ncbi:MAG: carbonic anhydrase family protein, partial [Burkholderiales bacterium]|nr:carbonic anhydrase family protein [Burkholderiales bacterium]
RVTVGGGNYIAIGNQRWQLVGFDFHMPSEDQIDGRSFDMEMHLLHQDSEGHYAVVALMLTRGQAQKVVQTIWNNLPLERNAPAQGLGTIDLTQLIPADHRYYNYMGSLTSPPCSEGVEWIVLNQPVEVSQQQIDIFAHLYPMNARPLQHADGRLIKQSR